MATSGFFWQGAKVGAGGVVDGAGVVIGGGVTHWDIPKQVNFSWT